MILGEKSAQLKKFYERMMEEKNKHFVYQFV